MYSDKDRTVRMHSGEARRLIDLLGPEQEPLRKTLREALEIPMEDDAQMGSVTILIGR